MTNEKIHILANSVVGDSFPVFVANAFRQLHSGRSMVLGRHVLALCYELERVLAGDNRYLLATSPPRCLKSFIASVCFPAFALGHDPSLKLICLSYSGELAESFSRQTQLIMDSPSYRQRFPNTRFVRNTAAELRTTTNGFRAAKSLGGAITGTGGDILILDDPLNAGSAASEAERRSAYEKYSNVLPSRFDDPKLGAMAVVAQRLHVDDLPGHLIAEGGWHHLNLPMTAWLPQDIAIAPGKNWHRNPGDLLHAERFGPAEIERLKKQLGSSGYAAQYDQRPALPEGNVFKLHWFKRFPEQQFKKSHFEMVIASWDTGLATSETASFSACTVWGIRGKQCYLLHAFRDRIGFTDILKKIIELKKQFLVDLVVLERAASGPMLCEELWRQGHEDWVTTMGVEGGDKRSRAEAQTAKIEEGRVFLPSRARFLEAFETDVALFPHCRHPDWIDTMTQFLRLLDNGVRYIKMQHLSMYDDYWGR